MNDINLIVKELRSFPEWENSVDSLLKAAPNGVSMDMNAFLKHCTPMGGNWGGMLLSGVKELWPEVWDAVPDNMGHNAFAGILCTLELCGVNV